MKWGSKLFLIQTQAKHQEPRHSLRSSLRPGLGVAPRSGSRRLQDALGGCMVHWRRQLFPFHTR